MTIEKDQPTPKKITEFVFGGITEMRFFEPHFTKESLCYPFGGAMCSRMSLAEPNRWMVYRYSAIPGYGWKLLSHPTYGTVMPMTQAIQLAREMQG